MGWWTQSTLLSHLSTFILYYKEDVRKREWDKEVNDNMTSFLSSYFSNICPQTMRQGIRNSAKNFFLSYEKKIFFLPNHIYDKGIFSSGKFMTSSEGFFSLLDGKTTLPFEVKVNVLWSFLKVLLNIVLQKEKGNWLSFRRHYTFFWDVSTFVWNCLGIWWTLT